MVAGLALAMLVVLPSVFDIMTSKTLRAVTPSPTNRSNYSAHGVMAAFIRI
ncbi:MAG: hypothetical protein WA919_09265 [Coleofasciculaceae cyanobacterium]